MARFRVSLLLDVSDDATLADVLAYVYDLEWVGGNRDPENDPMFYSATVVEAAVTRGRARIKALRKRSQSHD